MPRRLADPAWRLQPATHPSRVRSRIPGLGGCLRRCGVRSSPTRLPRRSRASPNAAAASQAPRELSRQSNAQPATTAAFAAGSPPPRRQRRCTSSNQLHSPPSNTRKLRRARGQSDPAGRRELRSAPFPSTSIPAATAMSDACCWPGSAAGRRGSRRGNDQLFRLRLSGAGEPGSAVPGQHRDRAARHGMRKHQLLQIGIQGYRVRQGRNPGSRTWCS